MVTIEELLRGSSLSFTNGAAPLIYSPVAVGLELLMHITESKHLCKISELSGHCPFKIHFIFAGTVLREGRKDNFKTLSSKQK